MKFTDFTPPGGPPTHEQQRDALQKGLGRAVQWARAGVLDGGLLREACLNDLRYDKQCEDVRGEWLWKLISLSDRKDELRDPVLSALRQSRRPPTPTSSPTWAITSRRTATANFAQPSTSSSESGRCRSTPTLVEGVLLALDGLDAFRFLSKLHGQRLETRRVGMERRRDGRSSDRLLW